MKTKNQSPQVTDNQYRIQKSSSDGSQKTVDIKITVSEKLYKIIETKAKNMGVKTSTYCFNVVFSDIKTPKQLIEEMEK